MLFTVRIIRCIKKVYFFIFSVQLYEIENPSPSTKLKRFYRKPNNVFLFAINCYFSLHLPKAPKLNHSLPILELI